LRDTIAWSHDLLPPAEKTLFRRLSVFVGGWTLEAADAMAVVDGGEAVDAFQALATLIDQSLVDEWPTPDALANDPRYGMLESIREFAAEQLSASGEIIQAERAFEAFLIRKVEAAEVGLRGPEQALWLDRLHAEHDNLRAVLGRVLERGDGDVAIRLARRLWEFWWIRGYPREGRSWLERALALAGEDDMSARAAAEFGLGKLWLESPNYDTAEVHLRQSLDARRQLGDERGEAEVLSALAMIALNRLAYDQAWMLGEDALKIARDSGDRRSIASAMQILGMIAREQGEYERALELLGESMMLWRSLGDTAWTARVASQKGITHRLAGNVEQAQRLFAVSRELHTELGDRFALGVIASQSGHLAFDAGDIKRAVALYAEALRYFDSIGDPEGVVEVIEWLAVVAAANDEAVPALRLFGAAVAARETLHLPHVESDEKRFASGLDQATRAAGTAATTALADGRTLSLERARDEALEIAKIATGPIDVDP
jgi:predicted ATPase